MTSAHLTGPLPSPPADGGPTLDALARERLGRYLQALYEPVLDEGLDPRLAELLQQLDRDRAEQQGGEPASGGRSTRVLKG
ncbi:hypothetical protein [Methylobacterium crusticola]|nr:hypothetical protein [Methylobacterium crusticola]